MIANHMQKWIGTDKITSAPDGVAVTTWRILRHECQSPIPCRLTIRGFVAGVHHDAEFFHACLSGFLD
jgi:hypothetical protein